MALNIPGLNTDDESAGQGGYRFIPRSEAHCGSATLHLLSVREVKTFKSGLAINMKVKIADSKIADVENGEVYDLLFKFMGDAANFSNRHLRAIMCACFGGDPKNTKSDKHTMAKLDECVEAGGDLALGELKFLIVQEMRPNKEGTKEYCNESFQSLTGTKK
jgi:hypothetical protein